MSNPDEKKIHTYQDWLTWDGTWELINGKVYNNKYNQPAGYILVRLFLYLESGQI
ncbi:MULTISPECIES: hypothetical protein [Paenibacillus]|uniref:hypothetical protein n=1 Tax=Paenibacillus TaxID=44249 RepID=UPI0015C39439|nr:hypothetical protein [Paenibacillus borealis]